MLIVLRPLATPDLWWNLSRGREVISGSTSPSQQLLLLDTTFEADWLSGVPFYSLWYFGGIHALSAVPLAAAIFLIRFVIERIAASLSTLVFVILYPSLMFLLRPGLEPSPQLFDIFAFVFLWRLNASALTGARRFVAVFSLFILWANIAPQPCWGLLYLLMAANERTPYRSSTGLVSSQHLPLRSRSPACWLMWLAALLGGSVTPRGILTWSDSFLLFASGMFGDFGMDSSYRMFARSSSFTNPHLLMLWCSCAIYIIVRLRGWNSKVVMSSESRSPGKSNVQAVSHFMIPAIAAVLSPENIPLCSLWILLQLAEENLSAKNPFLPMKSILLASCLVLLLVGIDAVGQGLAPFHRIGWGISHDLDLRLLQLPDRHPSTEPFVAWTLDRRSAGAAAWLNEDTKLVDHPQRALLGGRLMIHSALIADLKGAHRAQYRRADGSWGGWYRQFSEWNANLLLIPAESTSLNRALHRSTWKIMDLDSSVVPFGSTDEKRFSSVILETLQQQGFVESGSWQPTSEVYEGTGWRWDLAEVAGLGPDPMPAIQQSQLFRAMDIPSAALRALLPIRQCVRHRALTIEFINCQQDLCYQEWSDFGAASYWRRRLVQRCRAETTTDTAQPWTHIDAEEETENADRWNRCLDHYLSGDLSAAAYLLSPSSSEQHFASAMISMEQGDCLRAEAEFQQTIAKGDIASLTLAAKYWKQQIESFTTR